MTPVSETTPKTIPSDVSVSPVPLRSSYLSAQVIGSAHPVGESQIPAANRHESIDFDFIYDIGVRRAFDINSIQIDETRPMRSIFGYHWII